jgi:7-cyano-7-deazaguanine synthase
LQSALLSGADAIPTADYAEDNLKQTVVPFRNGIFLAIASGIAESNGAEGIVIAAHGGDHALYPDCREDFMAAMASAISLGTYANLQILRPFIDNNKGEITAIGAELGVDFSHTYSCYCGREQHCGQCATCRERREAFAAAGMPDPTIYEQ